MTDQHGQAVALDVRQDGKQPGFVPPGRRVRFKIRARTLAYRVEHVVLGDCEHWHVHDVRVGGQSQLSSVGDSPEEDGFPGAVFSPDAVGCFLSFETVQTAMDLVFDVAYRGPAPDGALFDCSLRCTAAYGDERDDEVAVAERASGPQFVGRWGSLVPGDRAQLGARTTAPSTPRPGCNDELTTPEAEQKSQPRRKMMLVSDNPSRPTEAICVTGTRSSIIQAARRMATRTRGCVSISQIVWQYHRAGCDDGSGEPPGTEGVDWTAGDGGKAEELRQGIERFVSAGGADQWHTSWDEVVRGVDLRAALDSVRLPYGEHGRELARRALAGDLEAVDAFASLRRVTLVRVMKAAGFGHETRKLLINETDRLQDDDGFRRDQLATAIRAGVLQANLGYPLTATYRATLEAYVARAESSAGLAIVGVSEVLTGAVRALLSALDAESDLLGPSGDV